MLFISFLQVTFLLNYYLAKASKIYLIIPAVSSLETAGFIRYKNTHFYGFTYIFIVVFFIILIISSDTVKNKQIVNAKIPKNSIKII